jgi:hypothetical protein
LQNIGGGSQRARFRNDKISGVSKIRSRRNTTSEDFIILTKKGMSFVKEWFGVAKKVPSDLTREFQMLVHVCCYGGVMDLKLLKEIGYQENTIEKARKEEFVVISKDVSKLEDNVKSEIASMVGKPPECLYT